MYVNLAASLPVTLPLSVFVIYCIESDIFG